VESENGHAVSRHESVKDTQQYTDNPKSASFISTHTNATDADGHVLMQSSISIGANTQTEGDDDVEYKPTGEFSFLFFLCHVSSVSGRAPFPIFVFSELIVSIRFFLRF